ncbi:MAG: hypothetical protein HOC70_06320 [Gammaproteobacteria bacterium]|jgi:hypothetical protein|nr:hypothetical protein [Gammaproteobacteria bacterium]MBT4492844.1 hypothetical protein [Gammaproteobacteria bacterium]MBT7371488.1 hypothetical protein [Gammaproteobacteria bacterium]
MQEGHIPINTKVPEELAKMVNEIDPELTFIRDLHPLGTTCRTLLVDQNGTERILKVRAISSNVWDDTYFFYEIHALRRVAERNISNVTHLVGEYNTDRYHAILKTYAEGTPFSSLDHLKLLRDPEFIRKLDALYLQLHLAGIAKIHFQPRKFVIGANDELTLVDLSTCIVNTEAGISLFSQEMRADSRFINKLENVAKKAA